jgi:hypothetical protein
MLDFILPFGILFFMLFTNQKHVFGGTIPVSKYVKTFQPFFLSG